MIKRSLHILVLITFVVSTMSSLAASQTLLPHHQMLQQEQASSDAGTTQDAHANHTMAADHSCCDDMQQDAKNPDTDPQCCASDCQCMTACCAQAQALYSALDLHSAYPSVKVIFAVRNKHTDSHIIYQLKRPPKS